jgi:hypothetical protein
MAITEWRGISGLCRGATADGHWELCECGSGACGGPIRPGKAGTGNCLRGIIGPPRRRGVGLRLRVGRSTIRPAGTAKTEI